MSKVVKATRAPFKAYADNPFDTHVHDTFSVLDGLGKPEDVVKRAVELKWPVVAITNHGNMMSAPIIYKSAKAAKIKPMIGCELYVTPDEFLGVQDKVAQKKSYHLTTLALSAEGYHNLVAWTTFANRRDEEFQNYYHKPRISLAAMVDVAPYPMHHNVIYSGCLAGELLRYMLDPSRNGDLWTGAVFYIEMMKTLFPNFYIEIQNHRVDKFVGKGLIAYEELLSTEKVAQELLIQLSRITNVPVVVTNDSHMQWSKQRKSHLAMKIASWKHNEGAMDHMSPSAVSDQLKQYVYFGNYMRSMEEVVDGLPRDIRDSALQNICDIGRECDINLSPLDKFSYCVAPNTPILTKNLEWISAGMLEVGDELWAFDENLNQGTNPSAKARRWRTSVVNKIGRSRLPSYRITFNTGRTLVVSEGHLWLACQNDGRAATQVEWRATNRLKIGDRIPRYLYEWQQQKDYAAGYLSALFDSEGHLSVKSGPGFAQVEGTVLEKGKALLEECGFDYKDYNSVPVHNVKVCGVLADKLAFLGTVRPERLIEKLESQLVGTRLQKIQVDEVSDIEFLGYRDMVTMSTSTKTFFADGYAAHNSIPFSGYDDPIAKMRKRAAKRLKELKKVHGKLAEERFEHEIKSMGDFAHYLMLMSDFIRGARKMGIRTHTRGSAANSLLCYCLGIHDIDSLHYSLTFERFYNPSRKKLPDIDIDINPDRYDDFMRMVFERMEIEEGKGQVVKICNYGTFANRAAFRLVAESQGVDKELIDEISKLLPSMIDSGMVEEEDDAFELIKEEYPQIYELASGVFDSVKSVSQHACAWLFGTKDRPVESWIPLTLIASSNTLVTQYNYKLIDKYFGMVKGDFLKLKTLSVMDRTMELAKLPFDFEIPLDDPKTFEMLCKGDTEGVHSMQGKTQRQGCLEVKPQSVFDLIAIQALYRPSGTRTGFDKVFVARRHGKEKIKKIHPIADKHLKETYGLPIYQESTLDIGYSLGMSHEEIQQLLDAIKMAKGVGRGAAEAFETLKPTFMRYAKQAGFKKKARDELWRLIDAFQGYGFNKGHATSYGILADQTAYLKCHYPREFYTALLDVYPDKSKYIAAARGSGFRFDPPCINFSQFGFSPGTDRDSIRVGLSRIKFLGPVAVNEIIKSQPFSSFDDFQSRVPKRAVNTTRIDVLAAIGAFDILGVERPPELIIKRKEKGKEKTLILDHKDLIEFVLLGFCLDTPEAMQGIRPLHTVKNNERGEWRHKGYQSGVELTEGPTSVSKMFWIPPLPKENIYEKKASAWAKVKTTLVTAIDENGIPFQLKANESKAKQVETLEFLARMCRGAVVCLDGAVRAPFLADGKSPFTFQLFNVSGAFKDDPQIYFEHDKIDDIKLAVTHLARKKNPDA